jgi:hypothetical protein
MRFALVSPMLLWAFPTKIRGENCDTLQTYFDALELNFSLCYNKLSFTAKEIFL